MKRRLMAQAMKECFKCRITKPLEEFYRHSQMADGHIGKCKECTKKDTKTRTDKLTSASPEWIEAEKQRQRDKIRRQREDPEHQHRMLARGVVRLALLRKQIQRGACEKCGEENAEAHHDDYSKALEIRWLCKKHHREHHEKINREMQKLLSSANPRTRTPKYQPVPKSTALYEQVLLTTSNT